MKCTIPEISWHNREPVLSVDIHPVSENIYKLASGGGDSHILIWQMVLCENGSVKQEVISDLTRHQRSVNTVRWSSTGQYLASADDDANIIIWQLKTDNIPLLEGNTDDKEVWIVHRVLRGHKEDIYDLCWSIDNLKLFSGSVDNTAIIWDLAKGKLENVLTDHKGFVQGVAWDPQNQLIATISTDRVCRIFDKAGKHVKARIHKGKLPVPDGHFLHNKESKYFHDDTFKSFFRRLQFTPDGSLLIVPSGNFQADDCKKMLNSTLIFTMDNWTEPAAVLPLEKQSSTVVRCCPQLFQHRTDGPEPVVKLPYRMIFAIGTDHDIILYDTQQAKPFARFHEIHYTRITDLTWSKDGLLLIASSTDGFCSLITFEPKELGEEYVKEEVNEESNVLNVIENVEPSLKDENIDITNKNTKEKEEAKKRPSFIVQWAQSTPKKSKIENNKDLNGVIEINDDENSEKSTEEKTPEKVEENKTEAISKKDINKLTPRRITPIKIGDKTKTEEMFKQVITQHMPKRIKPTKIEGKDNNKTTKTEESPKKEINKLTPRRISPIKVDGNKNANESKLEANKISNNRQQPIRVESGNKDKPEKQLKEIKIVINRLMPRRITPKKIGNSNKSSSDIEVRKNTLDTESSKEHLLDKSIDINTKQIEIRSMDFDKKETHVDKTNNTEDYAKKSIALGNKDTNTKDNEILVKIKSSGTLIDNLNKIEDETILINDNTNLNKEKNGKESNKEISRSKQTKITKVLFEDSSTKNLSKKTDKIKNSKTKDMKNTPKINKKTSPTLIEHKSDSKKDQPKVKVGSLVRKKLITTPLKSNPLLDFLKKSGEKKRNKPEPVLKDTIDLICEEDARDGFSKEKERTQNKKSSTCSSPEASPLDDITEDFCLQLEDTQEEDKKNVSLEKMDIYEEIKEDKNTSRVIEISDDSCSSPLKKIEENLVQKKPRRVPLITLSSPKGKNKPVTENILKE